MRRLLILDEDYQEYLPLVQQYYPDWQVFASDGGESDKADQCDIWLGASGLCADLLKQGIKPPKWIQSTFAGITPLMADDLPKNYLLSRAVGVFEQLMAEYVLTYMLLHERQGFSRIEAQKRQHWLLEKPGTLRDKQVLIVGAGSIGTGVAKFLKPFGVHLLGIANTARSIEPFEKVGALSDLIAFVRDADYVINLLPDTPTTHSIYDAKVFNAMKEGAVFINAGRGTSVVDEDLVIALDKGKPSLAVLDVFRTEPLPENHLFWRVPNILITEHTAAISIAPLIFGLFRQNIERFEKNQLLIGQVNFRQGY